MRICPGFIGVWILATTAPRLVYDTIALNSVPYADHSELHDWVVCNLVQLRIAAWLILGAKGIRKVFRWVQYAGIEKGSLE